MPRHEAPPGGEDEASRNVGEALVDEEVVIFLDADDLRCRVEIHGVDYCRATGEVCVRIDDQIKLIGRGPGVRLELQDNEPTIMDSLSMGSRRMRPWKLAWSAWRSR